MRILIVEDDESTAAVVKTLLGKELEAAVEIALDCASARELLSSNSYDLITLDYELPDEDGLSLLEEIVRMDGAPPVIMVTCHGDESTAVSAFKLGASGYVVKDTRMSTMLVEEARSALTRAGLGKAENINREWQARLERLTAATPTYICEIDRNGVITFVNRTYEGKTHDDVVGTPLVDWFPEELRTTIEELVESVYWTGDLQSTKYSIPDPQGDIRTYLTSLTPITVGGKVTSAVLTANDVTELMTAEEALRQSEAEYRAVVEDQTELIVRFKQGGIMTFLNDAICSFTGLPREELLGKSFMTFIPEGEQMYMQEQLASLDEENPIAIVEHRVVLPSSEVRYMQWANRALFDEQGNIIEFQGVGRDTTERKRIEEALRESEVRFRTVADFTYDWETWRGPDGTYVYISPSCERVSGYLPEEFMADPELFVRIVHPDDREAVISHFEEELASQHALHLEFRIIDREGSEHWIGHTCQPVHKEDGTPLGPRASNRDITERKKAEVELGRHRENLEELIKDRTAELEKLNARLRVEISERVMAEKELLRLNEELDAYARTVSHELRTPLAGIWLALEYLERISGELSTERFEEEARDTVLKAKSTVKKADEQVKRLLELAEAGQVPTNVSDVDVSEIVGEVLSDIEEERSRSGARVEVNGDLGLIRANPTHIHQLFSNLIVNAIRHCDSREPQIEIALLGQESGTGRKYLVRDNGSGIPPELIDQLFSPFVKREGGGTGTGLAIVEKIVKIYNGSIRTYNEDGACFEFVLYDYQRSGVPNVRI